MKTLPLSGTLSVAMAILLPCHWAAAADWPMQGRDNSRNAVSPEKNPPLAWHPGTALHRGARTVPSLNILWSAELGSQSWSDPVIANGLVWVGTNNARPRDPSQAEEGAVLMCFRESDGKFLYQYVSPRRPEGKIFDWEYHSLGSSPLVDGDLIWFCTNRAEVVCLEVAALKKGEGAAKVVWKLDMMKDLGVQPSTGMIGSNAQHCSVASHGDRIYVNTTHGADRYHKMDKARHALVPSLICLNKLTGELMWEDHTPGSRILDVQQGSPLVVEIQGRAQVIMGQGDGWLRSFDAMSGEKLWEFDINFKAVGAGRRKWSMLDQERQATYFVASPVFNEGRIYIASGRHAEDCSGPGRLVCIDPTKSGDISSELEDGEGHGKPNPNSGLVWDYLGKPGPGGQEMSNTLSSVVIDQGLVFAPDFSGLVHCLDARTGDHRWAFDTRGQIYGSALIVDSKLYISNEEGELFILGLNRDKPQKLASHEFSDPIYASPVYANAVLYVTIMRHLYAIKNLGL